MTESESRAAAAKARVTPPALPWDALLAAAARRLVKIDKADAGLALTEANITRMVGGRQWTLLDLELEVSADYFDVLTDPDVYLQQYDENDFGQPYPIQGSALLATVFTAVLPPGVQCDTVEVKVRVDPVTDDWREQVRASLESGPSNQGRPFGTSKVLTHAGLNYRTKGEVAIAKVLELTDDILFLPNCSATSGKVRNEPDFLIFFRQRVGVLEVDGGSHIGRAAEDSLRDTFFQRQGIFIKHYPSEKCESDPAWVVKDFLRLLLKAP